MGIFYDMILEFDNYQTMFVSFVFYQKNKKIKKFKKQCQNHKPNILFRKNQPRKCPFNSEKHPKDRNK